MFGKGTITAFLSALCLLASSEMPAANACVVPIERDGRTVVSVTEASRARCIDASRFAGPRPALSVENMLRGPEGRPGAVVYCRFIPYKMHLKGGGKSLKFWCHKTDGAGRYYNDRHELADAAADISVDGLLVDAGGVLMRHADGRPQRAEVIKVKYTNGGNRGREVHTEVAAGRFFWALGLPADRMFAARVWCDGCSEDPFEDIRSAADNVRGNATSFFPHASVESPFPGRKIETEDDEGWDWGDAYDESAWSDAQRVEFEAYVLAANMIHFHHGLSKQNTLACADGHWDPDTGLCSKPVMYLDDMGASFGGGRSRGEYDKYRGNKVFANRSTCELRADLAGFGRVSEAARRFLVERLNGLDEPVVRAIFEVAGFTEDTTGASAARWTAVFMERIDEVRSAACR